ncbi:MAG: Cof-type HAD-IIB family hydrolase [Firmicutes bacterium]|nr:Cof-type HAD-IIB family hydrolase [Bacillota bacterium]
MALSAPFALVALDLDGTALKPDGTISDRLKRAVKQVRERGIHVILATGRMVQSAARYWQEFQLGEGPLVAYQGAVVALMPSANVIHQISLPEEGAYRVVEWALGHDLVTQVYVGRELWVSREDVRVREYIDANQIPAWVRGAQELTQWPEPPIKILMQADGEVLDRLRPELQALVKPFPVRVFKSQTDYLEVVHEGVGKARGLAIAADVLGVRANEVLAIGDAENDVDMLQWAGFGVAMGQAPEAVKRAANAVTLAVEEDGAAVALEQWVLEMPGE